MCEVLKHSSAALGCGTSACRLMHTIATWYDRLDLDFDIRTSFHSADPMLFDALRGLALTVLLDLLSLESAISTM